MDEKDLETTLEIKIFREGVDLVPAIVKDWVTNEVLMLGYVNREAFRLTSETGYATFWNMPRQELWKKGETSGDLLKIKQMKTNCDQKTLLYVVEREDGGCCHTKDENDNYKRSCCYRTIKDGNLCQNQKGRN